MKKLMTLWCLVLIFIMMLVFTLASNAQETKQNNKPSFELACSFDEPYCAFYGDIYVTQGSVRTYTIIEPYAGHTYTFSALYGHGIIIGFTAYTVTMLWSTPGGGYACGYIHYDETNELGYTRHRTKNVVIIP